MSLVFYTYQLFFVEQLPSIDDLGTVFSGTAQDSIYRLVDDTDTYYKISKEIINNEYFWLNAHYGNSLPYSQTVYNTNESKQERNPRKTEQVEIDSQLFALYAVNSHKLYLSHKKKSSLIEKFLSHSLAKNVSIKPYFINAEDFTDKIKSVSNVKFKISKNLFSPSSSMMEIFEKTKDLYGLGEPADFTLEANFTCAHITGMFKKFMKMGQEEAKSLVCVGRNNKDFETVFNNETFSEKINLDVNKDNQGLYDLNSVKSKLIEKIRTSDEEKT